MSARLIFAVDADGAPQGAAIVATNARAEIAFDVRRAVVTVGRGPGVADLVVDDLALSRLHVTFFFDSEGVEVVDGRSSQGTFVNGKRVERARLHEGDLIYVGSSRLEVVHR